MYSNEFMKFLFAYQKDNSVKKEPKNYEIHFKNRGSGKPAKVYVAIENK